MKEAAQKSEKLVLSKNQFPPLGFKNISIPLKAGGRRPLGH